MIYFFWNGILIPTMVSLVILRLEFLFFPNQFLHNREAQLDWSMIYFLVIGRAQVHFFFFFCNFSLDSLIIMLISFCQSKLKELQYQLAPWRPDVNHLNFAPQSLSHPIGVGLTTSIYSYIFLLFLFTCYKYFLNFVIYFSEQKGAWTSASTSIFPWKDIGFFF